MNCLRLSCVLPRGCAERRSTRRPTHVPVLFSGPQPVRPRLQRLLAVVFGQIGAPTMGGDVVADEPFPRAALAEADEPLPAARPSVGGGQKRRQNKEPTDCADGPLVAVAVVGQSEHRWGNMFRSVAGQGALRLVEDRLQEIGLSVDRACGGPASIVGMCVMRSWSFAGTPGVEERHMAAMLMKEVRLQTAHVDVLRFPILAAARLLDPVAIDLVDVGDITRAEARLHVRTLCSDSRLILSQTTGGTAAGAAPLSVKGLLEVWRREFDLSERSDAAPVLWTSWRPLAGPQVRLAWPLDAARIKKRDRQPVRLLPGRPGERVEREFWLKRRVALEVVSASASDDAEDQEVVGTRAVPIRGSHVKRFPVGHLIRALRASQNLRSGRALEETAGHMAKFLDPRGAGPSIEELKADGFEFPSDSTLIRARVRLDVVSMLLARIRCRTEDCFRYISYDASPINFIEEFGAIMDSVPRAALESENIDSSMCSRRRLPLMTLGHGRAGLAEKTLAMVHKHFLESGPHADDIHRVCGQVRASLSEMGVEFKIIDFFDCIPHYLKNLPSKSAEPIELPDAPPQKLGYLHPNAVGVPGVCHLTDWLAKTVLAKLGFWSEWRSQARRVVQFLRSSPYRNKLLVHFDKMADIEGLPEEARSKRAEFSHCSASFAQWRWRTLEKVCKELERIKEPLRQVWGQSVRTGEWRIRDGANLKEVDAAVSSTTFWCFTKIVQAIVGLIGALWDWATGCSCHEDALTQKKNVVCFMKGRRAPELGVRLNKFYSDAQSLLQNLDLSTFPTKELQDDFAFSVRLLVAEAQMKFGWVSELPWCIWGCLDRESARQSLELYDKTRAHLGEQHCHRVSSRFFGDQGFRQQLVHFIEGGQLDSAVRTEIRAYGMTPLDESAVEGVHREIKLIKTKAVGSEEIWWGASWRLGQSLDVYDSMGGASSRKQRLASWKGWKSILRQDLLGSRKMVNMKVPTRNFLAQVYWSGPSNLKDWGQLGTVLAGFWPREPAKRMTVEAKLRAEHCASIFVEKGVYSVPIYAVQEEFEQAWAAAGGALRLADAAFAGKLEQNANDVLAFQILDKAPLQKTTRWQGRRPLPRVGGPDVGLPFRQLAPGRFQELPARGLACLPGLAACLRGHGVCCPLEVAADIGSHVEVGWRE